MCPRRLHLQNWCGVGRAPPARPPEAAPWWHGAPKLCPLMRPQPAAQLVSATAAVARSPRPRPRMEPQTKTRCLAYTRVRLRLRHSPSPSPTNIILQNCWRSAVLSNLLDTAVGRTLQNLTIRFRSATGPGTGGQ